MICAAHSLSNCSECTAPTAPVTVNRVFSTDESYHKQQERRMLDAAYKYAMEQLGKQHDFSAARMGFLAGVAWARTH